MNDARGVIKKLNIKGRADWRKLCKSRKKPNGIPAGIESFYKDQGWKGWEDFLGTGKDKKFLFPAACRFMLESGIDSFQKKWQNFLHKRDKI